MFIICWIDTGALQCFDWQFYNWLASFIFELLKVFRDLQLVQFHWIGFKEFLPYRKLLKFGVEKLLLSSGSFSFVELNLFLLIPT